MWIVNDQTVNGSETGTSFRQALWAKECGFNLHDTMIWDKESFSFPESNRYQPVFEYMFVFTKGRPKTFNPIKDKINTGFGNKIHGSQRQKDGTILKETSSKRLGKTVDKMGRRYNVWQIWPASGNETGHPATFPIQLAADHIRTWSDEGDTVLDPFLGSGTTRIAAYDLNRQFIGFEISEEYFRLQEERFARHTAQMNLFID